MPNEQYRDEYNRCKAKADQARNAIDAIRAPVRLTTNKAVDDAYSKALRALMELEHAASVRAATLGAYFGDLVPVQTADVFTSNGE